MLRLYVTDQELCQMQKFQGAGGVNGYLATLTNEPTWQQKILADEPIQTVTTADMQLLAIRVEEIVVPSPVVAPEESHTP